MKHSTAHTGVSEQPTLFGLTPETPVKAKGWVLTKLDANTVQASRGTERHTIRSSYNLFSSSTTWDIPADLPAPIRAAAMNLLAPEVSVQEPEPVAATLVRIARGKRNGLKELTIAAGHGNSWGVIRTQFPRDEDAATVKRMTRRALELASN